MLRAFFLLLMATLVIVGAAWYLSQRSQAEKLAEAERERVDQGFLATRQELNDKLEEYKRRKSDVLVQIQRIDRMKQETTVELRETGVTTAQDLEQNPDAKRKFQAVRQYMQDIEKLNGDVRLFDDAISAIDSGLRELDRQQMLENVGVDSKTYEQLRTVVKDIDARLSKPESAVEELQTQETLDAILGDKVPVGGGGR